MESSTVITRLAAGRSSRGYTVLGAICTLYLSFNNGGPLGTFFRYIGDTATYIDCAL